MTSLVQNRAHTLAAFGKLRTILYTFLCLTALPFSSAAEPARDATESTNVLRTVAAIRNLARGEAQKALPVQLKGVITYWGRRWYCFFSDETGGIFLNVKLPQKVDPTEPTVGDLVEVTGITAPGDFAPVVNNPIFRKLGKAALPPAKNVSLDRLMEGQEDSQFVQTSGIVRRVMYNQDHIRIELATSNGRFAAICPDMGTQPPSELIDSRVYIRGACGTLFNQKGQLRGIQICFHNSEGGLEVINKGKPDPFTLPVTPIQELGRFSVGAEPGHRVRINGVVTLVAPGDILYIEDKTGGVMVRATHSLPARVGDFVDVGGFPALGQFTPILEDAIYGVKGKAENAALPRLMDPTKASGIEATDQIYNFRLVTLDATLLDVSQSATGQRLILQSSNVLFRGILPKARGYGPLEARAGSIVRVTGVCHVETDDRDQPTGFQILLRDNRDVEILEEPPWWSLRHWLWVALALAVIAGLVSLWANTLRNKVIEQTAQMRQQLEREACFGELVVRLSGAKTLEEAAQAAGEAANELIGWHEFLVATRSNKDGAILTVAQHGSPSATLRDAVDLNQLAGGPRLVSGGAVLAAPMRHGNAITGFLALRLNGSFYSLQSVPLAQSLADHLAGAFDRIAAHERLRRSQERFNLAARATNDAIYDWDALTNRMWSSDNFEKVFGYSGGEEENAETTWLGRIHKEDRERVEKSFRAFVQSAESS